MRSVTLLWRPRMLSRPAPPREGLPFPPQSRRFVSFRRPEVGCPRNRGKTKKGRTQCIPPLRHRIRCLRAQVPRTCALRRRQARGSGPRRGARRCSGLAARCVLGQGKGIAVPHKCHHGTMARLAGPVGTVHALDVQEPMPRIAAESLENVRPALSQERRLRIAEGTVDCCARERPARSRRPRGVPPGDATDPGARGSRGRRGEAARVDGNGPAA